MTFADVRRVATPVRVSLAFAIGWAVFGLVGMFIPAMRSALPLLYLMSAWALVAAYLAEWAGHRGDERAQERMAELARGCEMMAEALALKPGVHTVEMLAAAQHFRQAQRT